VESSVWQLLIAATGGTGLGVLYFGGLWLTVTALPTSRHPAVLFLGSFVLRMAATLAGFYLLMNGRWERAIACMLGFLVVRFVLTATLGPDRLSPTQEVQQ